MKWLSGRPEAADSQLGHIRGVWVCVSVCEIKRDFAFILFGHQSVEEGKKEESCFAGKIQHNRIEQSRVKSNQD